jgi:hypothetical protein
MQATKSNIDAGSGTGKLPPLPPGLPKFATQKS